MTTPCAGQWRLFDSNLVTDHERAAELCRACPMLAACSELATDEKRRTRAAGAGFTGTWAGRLYGVPIDPLEHAFTPAEIRKAHADYARGDRSPTVVYLNRIYERRAARKKNARRREKAAS